MHPIETASTPALLLAPPLYIRPQAGRHGDLGMAGHTLPATSFSFIAIPVR